MKNTLFILALLLSILSFNLFAQSQEPVKISGYYLVGYSKTQMENIEKNKLLKQSGMSYFEALGTESHSIFIPTEDIKKSLSTAINEYQYDYRNTNFFLPQKETDRKYITKNTGEFIDFDKESSYFKTYSFYASPLTKDEVFKIYYVEANAVKYHLSNTKENRLKFGLFADDVSKGDKFDVVLVYHYTLVANDFVHLDDFEKWVYKPR